MALGLAFLVAGRQRARDRAALLDALTIATGIGLVTAVVVIQPAVTDLGDGVLAPILASAYPLADVLLLAVAARLWFTPCRTLPAYHLLMASIAAQLIGDIGYNAVYLAGGGDLGTTGFGLMLLLTYVGVAATTLHPSVRTISEPAPAPVERLTRGRLAVLALTSILAPAAMITNGALGLPLYWEVVGPGSILLLVLVLARVAGLVQQVQRQAVQLAALARNDALTGVPNRRTWDHELSRACAAARDQDTLLSVALLDLDNFKRFNDTSGHAAGDLLLKSATAAWRSVLADDAFLARYGGEEFTVLFPGRTASEAYAELDTLRSVTPMGQNFSAGVATWDTAEQPAVLVARADALLYEAKRSGRGRTLPLPLPLPLPTSADLTGRTDISGQRDSHR
jgi:diguanylate cyclase (GGDEF)-like protein